MGYWMTAVVKYSSKFKIGGKQLFKSFPLNSTIEKLHYESKQEWMSLKEDSWCEYKTITIARQSPKHCLKLSLIHHIENSENLGHFKRDF